MSNMNIIDDLFTMTSESMGEQVNMLYIDDWVRATPKLELSWNVSSLRGHDLPKVV